VINLIDFFEEVRPLTWRETKLRALITTILSRVTQAKLTIWKQRSKIRAAIEGDENTSFFHACANQRRRKNQIQVIEHNSYEVHNHDQKAAILHDFYTNLLGSEIRISWSFSLSSLYPEGSLNLSHLDATLNMEEIFYAFRRCTIMPVLDLTVSVHNSSDPCDRRPRMISFSSILPFSSEVPILKG
jgi:hypothetical protein